MVIQRWGFVVCLVLAACGGPNRYQVAMSQIDAEAAGCPKSPMTANAQCTVAIERRTMGPLLGRNSDLLDTYIATRLAVASRVDRGEMRREEAVLQLAQAKTALVSEFERRRTSQAAVAAASGPRTCISTPGLVTCN